MNRQYPPAFGLSFVLHVFVVAVAVSLSARPVLRRIPVTLVPAASSKRAAPAPSELPDSSKDDEMLRLDPGASLLNLPGFEFDFRKVAQRAASLFPFLRFERLTFPRVAPQ